MKYFRNVSFAESFPLPGYTSPMNRTLYLIAYDITNVGRLNNTRRFLKGYSTGGQKSVFECFLTQAELRYVTNELNTIIDADVDRIHIFTMDGRSKTHTLGIGVQPADPEFFYIG
jgi:CRISPR-associated protein Cas2